MSSLVGWSACSTRCWRFLEFGALWLWRFPLISFTGPHSSTRFSDLYCGTAPGSHLFGHIRVQEGWTLS
uniref:Uncharacterized protein n=1 Tax=Physcomitrium patens TaxID=3218 RepID=A0A7I3Z4J5_PHYPA